MKTTVLTLRVDDEWLGAVKARAVDEGRSVGDVVRRAVRMHLLGRAEALERGAEVALALETGAKRAREVVRAPEAEPVCRRCGHAERRHGPRCDYMGCMCGSFLG